MKYQEKFEVASSMIDRNGHIRPSDLIRFMQETADHQMRDEKPSYVELFEQGQAFIITRMLVKVHAQLLEYDHVLGSTWSAGCKGATFYRNYLLERGEELCAEAYSEWTVVNHKTGKLCRASEVDISSYSKDELRAPVLPKRFRFPKDLPWEEVEVHRVRYSECDMNRHMNNAVYLNLLWDHIPEIWDKEVTSLNIRYMHEAAEGTAITIRMTQIDSEFSGDPDAEEVFGFLTEVEGQTNVECMIGVRRAV